MELTGWKKSLPWLLRQHSWFFSWIFTVTCQSPLLAFQHEFNTFLFFFPFLIHILQVWIHFMLGIKFQSKAKFLFYISKSYTQWTIQHTCKTIKFNPSNEPTKMESNFYHKLSYPSLPSSLSNTHIHTMAPNKNLKLPNLDSPFS